MGPRNIIQTGGQQDGEGNGEWRIQNGSLAIALKNCVDDTTPHRDRDLKNPEFSLGRVVKKKKNNESK